MIRTMKSQTQKQSERLVRALMTVCVRPASWEEDSTGHRPQQPGKQSPSLPAPYRRKTQRWMTRPSATRLWHTTNRNQISRLPGLCSNDRPVKAPQHAEFPRRQMACFLTSWFQLPVCYLWREPRSWQQQQNLGSTPQPWSGGAFKCK